MEILPTLPDLDSSSSDGSVASIASVDDDNDDNNDNNNDQRLEVEEGDDDDDDDDVANDDDVDDDDDEQNNDTSTATTTSPKSPTRIKSIKPGGEDNEPIQPRRSISPVYSNSESSSKSTRQQQQQKAAATTLTRLANPLDAFDKSPETSPIKNGKNNKTTKKQNNINNKGKDEGEGNDATPVSEGDSIINNKKKEATTIPGLGGPPLTNNNNNNKNNKKGGGPSLTLRRMPQRSNLKKSSSFNVGDKKQHLRSALQQMSRITQNNNKTTNNNPNENTNNNESEDDNATGTGTTGESTNSINTGGGGAAAAGSNKKQSLRRGEPTRGVLRCSSMPVRARKPTMIEVRVRGERFPVQRHRHINFHQRVEIKEVEPVPEMVDGNCSDIWLQEEDFVKMKEDRRNVVRQIKKQQLLLQQQQQQQQQDDSSTSHHSQQQNQQNNNNYRPGQQPQLSPEQASKLRGLEKYVDRSIRAQKNMAWDTVLLEQDEQELSGDYNDERIADLYRHTTRESPNKAMTRAKQDEQEVQDYLWSPRTTKLLFRHKQVTSSPNTATSNNNNNNDHTATAAAKAKATVGFKTTIEGGLVAGPPKIAASDIMSTAENAEAAKNAAAPMAPPMMPEPATTTTTSPPTSTTTTTSSSASAITAPEAVPPMVRF